MEVRGTENVLLRLSPHKIEKNTKTRSFRGPLNFQNRQRKNAVKVQNLNFFHNGIEHVILEIPKSQWYNVDEKNAKIRIVLSIQFRK